MGDRFGDRHPAARCARQLRSACLRHWLETGEYERGVPGAELGVSQRLALRLSRATGERVYHLPFDQQYDTTVIEPDRGELYAATVAEAEELGFRRAWRWRPVTPAP